MTQAEKRSSETTWATNRNTTVSHTFVLSSKVLPWKAHLAAVLQRISPEKTPAPSLEGDQGQRPLPGLRPLQTTQRLLSTTQKYNAPNTAYHKPATHTKDITKLQQHPHPPPREASSNTLPSPAEPHMQASQQGLTAKAAAPRASQGRHKAGNTPQAWCRLPLTLLEGTPRPQLLIYPPAPCQPPAADGKVQAGGPGLPALPLVLN